MKKISVIIPIYNTEDFLRECLSSIQRQTYHELEILCVDDGSMDASGVIAEEYARADKRFVVIRQSNHGESHARNVALKKMTGDYVAFCDCDDWIELDMYEKLIQLAEESGAEMTLGSWFKEKRGQTEVVQNLRTIGESAFGREELLRYIYRRDDYQAAAYMWNKLYRRELFYDKQGELFLFDEKLELGGDVLYLAQLAVNTGKAVYLDRPFYHYRIKEESGSHTTDLKRLCDWTKAYEQTIDLLRREQVRQETIDYAIRFLAYRYSNIVEQAIIQGRDDIREEYRRRMLKYAEVYRQTNRDHPDRIERYQKLLESQAEGRNDIL